MGKYKDEDAWDILKKKRGGGVICVGGLDPSSFLSEATCCSPELRDRTPRHPLAMVTCSSLPGPFGATVVNGATLGRDDWHTHTHNPRGQPRLHAAREEAGREHRYHFFARTDKTRLPTVGGRDRVYLGEGSYYCTALYCATFLYRRKTADGCSGRHNNGSGQGGSLPRTDCCIQ